MGMDIQLSNGGSIQRLTQRDISSTMGRLCMLTYVDRFIA